jgi:CRP-like cAMP-binding protein
MYIIMTGAVRVFKTVNGEEVELGRLGRADYFGELSLLLDMDRSASVEAVERTELICLSKEALMQRIREDPMFAEQLVTTLARKLVRSNEIITELEGEKRSLQIIYGAG